MLVVLTITVAVGGILTQAVTLFYKSNTIVIEQQYQLDSARRGIERMITDIREASYGEDGSFPLAEMGSTSVTVFTDADGATGTERVRYSLINSTMQRNVVQPTGTPPKYLGAGATTSLSEYVRNGEDGTRVFRYYDSNGAEVTNVADIASVVYVTASLVVDVTKVHQPGAFTLKASATMRNLRKN